MSAPDFWNDSEGAQKLVGELKALTSIVDGVRALSRDVEDEVGLLEMSDEVRDRDHINEAGKKIQALASRVESLELVTLFNRPNNNRDVFLSIHAGTGGVDSMDWAAILLRMYQRWLDRNGYTATVVDHQPGEEAGIKRAVLEIRGKYPFGYLKSEVGVHRLVRISPFDANHRRHTSFASVDVVP